jgi:hypothetical protein
MISEKIGIQLILKLYWTIGFYFSGALAVLWKLPQFDSLDFAMWKELCNFIEKLVIVPSFSK